VFKSQVFNKGTNNLFRLYAMALAGQDITLMLPMHFDIIVEKVDGDTIKESKSCLSNNKINLVRTMESNGNNSLYGGVPFTRLSAHITNSAINSSELKNNDYNRVYLVVIDPYGTELAKVELNESQRTTFADITIGTQLLIVWDLYITNTESKGE
jgi:hypothetical protein